MSMIQNTKKLRVKNNMKVTNLSKLLSEALSRDCDKNDWYKWAHTHWTKSQSNKNFNGLFAESEYRKFYKFEDGLDPKYKIVPLSMAVVEERLAHQFDNEMTTIEADIDDFVTNTLEGKFVDISFAENKVVISKKGKNINYTIGKLLTSIDKDYGTNLSARYSKIKNFADTLNLNLDLAKPLTIVISRHPYDIAGASTGRSWTSCQDLNKFAKGDNPEAQKIENDLGYGTMIAYLMEGTDEKKMVVAGGNDTELNDKLIVGRMFIKRLHASGYTNDLSKTLFKPERKLYGKTYGNVNKIEVDLYFKVDEIINKDFNSKIGKNIPHNTDMQIDTDYFYDDTKITHTHTKPEMESDINADLNDLYTDDIEPDLVEIEVDVSEEYYKIYYDKTLVNIYDVSTNVLRYGVKDIQSINGYTGDIAIIVDKKDVSYIFDNDNTEKYLFKTNKILKNIIYYINTAPIIVCSDIDNKLNVINIKTESIKTLDADIKYHYVDVSVYRNELVYIHSKHNHINVVLSADLDKVFMDTDYTGYKKENEVYQLYDLTHKKMFNYDAKTGKVV